MERRISKRIAIVLALAVFLTSFAFAAPVDAVSTPDMKKANVKWDLKNNKTLKFKTKWTAMGAQTHKVKMTKFKIKKAKKKGYKQCTFTLTYKRSISPTDEQVEKMAMMSSDLKDLGLSSEGSSFGGGFYFAVVDYKTGKSLQAKNSKKVKVTSSDWQYSDYVQLTSQDGMWIRYPRKATVKVKIVYPKKYKNLAIGVGGYTLAPEYVYVTSTPAEGLEGTGVGAAGVSIEYKTVNLKQFWAGKKAFSKEPALNSPKSKKYAHFMRIKK